MQQERHLGLVKYLNHRILKNKGIYSYTHTRIFVCLFFFFDMGSYYIPGWPWTHCVIRLALKSKQSSCLILPTVEIMDISLCPVIFMLTCIFLCIQCMCVYSLVGSGAWQEVFFNCFSIFFEAGSITGTGTHWLDWLASWPLGCLSSSAMGNFIWILKLNIW